MEPKQTGSLQCISYRDALAHLMRIYVLSTICEQKSIHLILLQEVLRQDLLNDGTGTVKVDALLKH